MFPGREALGELLRYGLTGLASNALLYAAYLAIGSMSVDHKLSMTLVYCCGVVITFAFNRGWTFRDQGAIADTLWRYILTYAAGYLFNLAALWVLVDVAGLPHQWIMAGLIVITAALIFTTQKYWVFAARRPPVARQR